MKLTDKIKRHIVYLFSLIGLLLLAVVLCSVFSDKIDNTVPALRTDTAYFIPFDGDGTIDSPYLIKSARDLESIKRGVDNGEEYIGKYFSIENDIDAKNIKNLCIGNEEEDYYFDGYLNGNGHIIENLNIENDTNAGLFMCLNGLVCDLEIKDSCISGKNVGAFAGVLGKDGSIINCISEVELSGDNCGGICGTSFGEVRNVLSFGNEVFGVDKVKYDDHYSTKKSMVFISANPAVVENAYYYKNGLYIDYSTDNEISNNDIVNNAVSEYSVLIPEYSYHKWKIADDKIIFSDDKVRYLTNPQCNAYVGNTLIKLKGFYSEKSRGYCFVRPKAILNETWDLSFTSGENENYNVSADKDDKELSFVYDDIEYNVLLLEYEDAPTLFFDTKKDDGMEYLNLSKDNSLKAVLSVYEDNSIENIEVKELSGRGNSSFVTRNDWKNGLAVCLNDSQSILGLSQNDDYVLLPGHRWSSLMAYAVEKEIIAAVEENYPPEYKIVSVYVDDEYQGLYMLTGSQEIGSGRFELKDSYQQTKELNNNELESFKCVKVYNDDNEIIKQYYEIPNNPADITGGYLLEIDAGDYPMSRSRFISDYGCPIAFKSNNYASKQQVDYIANMWQDFENAAISEGGYNEKGGYYSDYLNVESMADLSLEFELAGDISLTGSVYFYKDSDECSDGKIHAGPHWDLERSFSEMPFSEMGSMINEIRYEKCENKGLKFWTGLYRKPDYMEVMRARWHESFLPLSEYVISDEICEDDSSIHTINYFMERYAESGLITEYRYNGWEWEGKGQQMKEYLKKRIASINKFLAE